MILKKATLFMAVVLVAGLLAAAANAADVTVIVNPGVSESSLTANTLESIYLGKTVRWGSGQEIAPATMTGTPAHEAFLDAYVKKSTSQFSTFWKKMVFTGQGFPPKNFDAETGMVAFVAATPGAIGYVPAGTDTGNARVVQITP